MLLFFSWDLTPVTRTYRFFNVKRTRPPSTDQLAPIKQDEYMKLHFENLPASVGLEELEHHVNLVTA